MSQKKPQQRDYVSDSDFVANVVSHVRADYRLLVIQTSDEMRLLHELQQIAEKSERALGIWTLTEGWQLFGTRGAKDGEDKKAPDRALDRMLDASFMVGSNAILVYKDFDDFWENPVMRRTLQSLVRCNIGDDRIVRTMIVVSPTLKIPDKLRAYVTEIDFSLPGENQLQHVADTTATSVKAQGGNVDESDSLREETVQAMRGLTSAEAENALALSVIRHKGFVPGMLGSIKEEKAAVLRRSEVLTYIDEEQLPPREEIGGYQLMMEYIERRKLSYTKEARGLKLDYPKGIVLLGLPGTGKSQCAYAIARVLGLPCVTFDTGAIFSSLVGASEARMRDALKQITALQGCVLLIDEADKAFGGAHQSAGDSGVTQRVFGNMLSWLAAKQDRTFVVMTMNRITNVPPEFLRAGRFDAIFYIDLPTEAERIEIMKIHFKKRGVIPETLGFADEDWQALAVKTDTFVGSELEEVVRESRYLAYDQRRSGAPSFEDVLEAAASVRPLSQLAAKEMNEIRDFCKGRARPVSLDAAAATGRKTRRNLKTG